MLLFTKTGRPLSYQYGYVAEGLFGSQEEIDNHAKQELGSTPMPGDIKYRDLNGDGVINSYDQAFISELGKDPRIQYGFGVNLTYIYFSSYIRIITSKKQRIFPLLLLTGGEGETQQGKNKDNATLFSIGITFNLNLLK